MKIIASLFLLGSALLTARTWTDVKGRALEAELVRVEGDVVIVKRNGAENSIKLGTLSQADQDHVAQWRRDQAPGQPAAAAAPGVITLDGKPIETGGKMNLIEKPYSAETLKILAKHKGESVGTGDSSRDSKKVADGLETGLKLAVAVPKDFNPLKPMNVFIVITAVNSEEERAGGNIPKFHMYGKSCVDNGWVCLAIDSNNGVPMNFATYDEAFALIEKSWSGFPGSRFAAGGFSGGSKGCWGPIAWLVKTKRNAAGVFMGGCNEDHSERFRKQLSAAASGYRKIRAFMSTGKADTIATTAHAESVKKSLKTNDVKNVRLEFFDGGHSLFAAHFEVALKWWAEPEK
jgi:hypothetical protein